MSPPIGFTVSTEPASVSRQSSTLEPTSATHGAKVPAADVSDAVKAKAWTFEAKAIGREAKAFKHTARAEIKICSTSDSLTGYVINKILIVFV